MLNSLIGLFVNSAYAVVDTDVASTSAGMLTSVKESVVDLFTTNMATIMGIVGIFIVVSVVLRLSKRITK
jgi:hypothetical protein